MKLILYTGPQCSLCDIALEIIEGHEQSNQNALSLSVDKINIRDSQNLYHLYGARIPVIKRLDTGAELGWPFSDDDLRVFLQ